jgi:hypothetical protein
MNFEIIQNIDPWSIRKYNLKIQNIEK